MGCLPLTSAPLPAWPVRGWGEFDPTLPVSTGRTWDSTKGTGWPPDSGTRDPALRRGLGSPCRPGWRVPLSAPPLPSLLSDHPSPPAPSLCSPLRPSATWRSATDLLLNFPRVLVPACGRDPSCSCREQGLTSPIHGSAGPNGRINRVASTRRQAESWPKAGACKHEWPRPGVGCSPPASPPHSPSLYWPCSRLTIPPPEGGQGWVLSSRSIGFPGVQEGWPHQADFRVQTRPIPAAGRGQSPKAPSAEQGGQGPQPRYCSKLRLRQGSVAEAPHPHCSAPLAPAPASPASHLPESPRGSLLGGQVSKCGTEGRGLLLLRGPGPSPLRIVGV